MVRNLRGGESSRSQLGLANCDDKTRGNVVAQLWRLWRVVLASDRSAMSLVETR